MSLFEEYRPPAPIRLYAMADALSSQARGDTITEYEINHLLAITDLAISEPNRPPVPLHVPLIVAAYRDGRHVKRTMIASAYHAMIWANDWRWRHEGGNRFHSAHLMASEVCCRMSLEMETFKLPPAPEVEEPDTELLIKNLERAVESIDTNTILRDQIMLRLNGKLSLREIAKHTPLSYSTVNNIVDRVRPVPLDELVANLEP